MSYTPRRTLCSSPAGYGVPILFCPTKTIPGVDTPGCILSPFQGSLPVSLTFAFIYALSRLKLPSELCAICAYFSAYKLATVCGCFAKGC